MTPGDIAMVWFPFSQAETRPYKKRPVLVLGSASVGTSDECVLVAMITSNGRRQAHPGAFDIVIDDWATCNLAVPSVVRANRLWTAEARDFAGTRGRVPADILERVREAIAVGFGFAVHPDE